jgi:hypothetical protein
MTWSALELRYFSRFENRKPRGTLQALPRHFRPIILLRKLGGCLPSLTLKCYAAEITEAYFMIDEDRLVRELKKFREQFNYKYVGGGYFRGKTGPKGISAVIQHGDEVVSKFCDDFVQYLSEVSR